MQAAPRPARGPWRSRAVGSPKLAQVRDDPRVDVQFQVAPPDFVHVMVRGEARAIADLDEIRRR